jgi:hypothetical protein
VKFFHSRRTKILFGSIAPSPPGSAARTARVSRCERPSSFDLGPLPVLRSA